MDFTQNEKYAILFILSEIMKADGCIDSKEQQFLEQMYEEFNITVLELSYILDLDFVISENIISSMTPEKKAKALTYFELMAQCDGFVDPREQELMKHFIGL